MKGDLNRKTKDTTRQAISRVFKNPQVMSQNVTEVKENRRVKRTTAKRVRIWMWQEIQWPHPPRNRNKFQTLRQAQ